MPSFVLPSRPSTEQLKRQARELRRSCLEADTAVRGRVEPFRSLLSAEPEGLTLTDAKLVLAREYGFESWPRLKHHVESLRGDYDELGNYMDLVRAGEADRAKFISDHYFALPMVRSGIHIDVHTASRLDLLERLVVLLEEDPGRVHQRDEVGLTPLHLAATDRIRNALIPNYGADPAACDDRFNATPAQWAVVDHRPLVAGSLLGEEGVVTDAIMLCALDMSEELRTSLSDSPGLEAFDLRQIPGGGVYAQVFGERTTLLHAAVYFGSEAVARMLLDVGADVEVIDATGATPLQRAFDRGFPGVSADRRRLVAVVSLLLERGASTKGVATGGEGLDDILKKAIG